MKILTLDLIAFGPFTNLSLRLSEGREGLHIIYGPNEAGKSSALRALRQLFFGIPALSRDNFIHAYPKFRIGATLRANDGNTLEFVRRKGTKNTLRKPDDDSVLDESLLRRFLGGADDGTFGNMFALDHATLVEGGRAIVQGNGDIGQILFAAGAGIANLRNVQRSLEEDAEKLFSSRGRNPVINQALSELESARRKIREYELPSSKWVEHDKALREAQQRKSAMESELEAIQRRRNFLRRIDQALPAIARRKTLLCQLACCRDAVILREQFADERRDAMTRLSQAEKDRQEATQALSKIEQAIADLQVPEMLLEQAEAVEELHRRLGSSQKAMLDRTTRLEPEYGQFLSDARRILRELRPDLELDQVEQLQFSSAARVRVRELAARYETMVAQQSSAARDMKKLEGLIDERQHAIAQLEPVCDPTQLHKAIESAQRQGDLDEQLEAARRKLRGMQDHVTVELRKLPLWFGTLQELEALPVPATEAIEEFRDGLAALDNDLANLRDQIRDIQQKLTELDCQIEELKRAYAVPSEGDLLEMRERRERGWHLVRRAWEHQDEDGPDTRDFINDSSPAADLPTAYELAVRGADEVSDRLRHEAERVAKCAELEANQRQCHAQLEHLRNDLEQTACRQGDLQRDWCRVWQACEIEPLSPKQMDAWIRQQRALADMSRELREQLATISDLENRIACHRSELHGRLVELGQHSMRPDESLAYLLGRARDLMQRMERDMATRASLDRDLKMYRRDRAEAQERARDSENNLARWRVEWSDAVQPLGLRPHATPAEADAVVERFGELLDKIRQADSHRYRMETIRREADEFSADVRRLAEQVAPSLANVPADRAAAELYAMLTRGRTAQVARDGLIERRTMEQKKIQIARQTMDEMNSRLALLCQQARCANCDELPAAELRSNQRRDLESQLQGLDERLVAVSGGSALDQFIADAEAEQADALSPQIQRLDEEIRRLEADRESLDRTIGAEQRSLMQMDGSGKAAEAVEELHYLLPWIQSAAEQYVRLRLASSVLRNAIERYRTKNQGPVLAHASELFEQLTLGSFESLRVDYTEGGDAVLVGVRPDGKGTVGVEGMSDGTADQLYLALRLASLETYFESHEPVPFIVDDLLINFDNDRAAAALKLLADLSHRTQVLFFTHHEHLVELARSTLDDAILFTHTLTAPQPSLTG